MAYQDNRVKETTTTTGTGSVTLAGSAPTGFQTFAAAFGAVSTVVTYVIELSAEWEVGEGTFNGTTTLTRDTVIESSNAGALVNFSAGTKNVFCDVPSTYITHKGVALAMSMGAYTL
jgi:hypothetical protein